MPLISLQTHSDLKASPSGSPSSLPCLSQLSPSALLLHSLSTLSALSQHSLNSLSAYSQLSLNSLSAYSQLSLLAYSQPYLSLRTLPILGRTVGAWNTVSCFLIDSWAILTVKSGNIYLRSSSLFPREKNVALWRSFLCSKRCGRYKTIFPAIERFSLESFFELV